MPLQFHCPQHKQTLSESECIELRYNKRQRFCQKCDIPELEATKNLYKKLLTANIQHADISFDEKKPAIRISFHKYLNIVAFVDIAGGEGYVEISCKRYGNTHFHPSTDDILNDLTDLLNGRQIIISKIGLIERTLVIVPIDYFLKYPKRCLLGLGVRIINPKGCYKKREYLERL